MEVHYRIELFGELRVTARGTAAMPLRTHKAGSLLAYLAINLGIALSREQLIEVFWPDRDIDSGRANLNTTLSLIRRILSGGPAGEEPVLAVDRRSVRLNERLVVTDVGEFKALIGASSRSGSTEEKIALLQEADRIYQRGLLPSCRDEWLLDEQQKLSDEHVATMLDLVHELERHGDLSEALMVAERAARVDPYAEEIFQVQMRLLVAAGRPAAAIKVYSQLEKRLRQDLDVAPGEATRRLIEALRRDPSIAVAYALPVKDDAVRAGASGKPDGMNGWNEAPGKPSDTGRDRRDEPGRSAPSVKPGDTVREPAGDMPSARRETARLPAHRAPMIGRDIECALLTDLVLRPDQRLITLTGPTGVGKTRLAVAVGECVARRSGMRAAHVDLLDVQDADGLIAAFAAAFEIPAPRTVPALFSVLEAEFAGQSLLLLDSCECCFGGARGEGAGFDGTRFIEDLLARFPTVTLLMTSQYALRIEGEQEVVTPLLPLPTPGLSPDQLLSFDSVALFVRQALNVNLSLEITPEVAETIAAICRRLDGLPLAIEMAAAWARALSPAQILARCAPPWSLLSSRRRDRPGRHASLRDAFEWSFQRLTPDLQAFFVQLSGCPDCATVETLLARQDKDGLSKLAQLQDRSLLVIEPHSGRMCVRFLKTFADFAAEKLGDLRVLTQVANHDTIAS